MSDIFIYLSIIVLGLAIGYFLGNYIQQLKTKSSQSALDERILQLQKNYEAAKTQLEGEATAKERLRVEKEELRNQITRNEADIDTLQQKNNEQKEDVEKLQEKFTIEFENLANKILEKNSEKFSTQNKESIKNILSPLQEKIKDFEKKVDDSQKENININSALRTQLETLQKQNLKITQEAENLTKALKGDSKMQGNWGELVLERVLEKSGLEKGREYDVQKNFTREDNSRVLPDVIINLPDNKKMIVDSKVSLTAYERYVNEESDSRDIHLKEHLASIRKHVEQLSEKKYEDLYEIESPDFVLMFIPIEPAFAIALNQDNTLYNKAFEKNIVIVTPTTLLATLRTIDTMWNNEKQQRNALEIARQAGALYDKFEGLVKDLTGIGKKIDDAKKDYSNAMNKLVDGRGNLITSVEKLKKMGAKAKKSLPENILKRAESQDLQP